MLYEFVLHVLIVASIFIILAVSMDLILGYAGMVQIGHGAFFALGAYASAIITIRFDVPFYVGFIAAGIVAGIVGFIVAASMIKVSSDYFALATYGLAVITYTVLMNWDSLTRGPIGLRGLPPVELFGRTIWGGSGFLAVTLSFVVITITVLYLLVNSPFGRALKAMRDDDIATVSTGRSIVLLKIASYTIGVIFAGFAGSLYAHYVSYIDPSTFTVHISILILAMVNFGGRGTLKGPVLGALILISIPEALRFLGLPGTMGGLISQFLYGGAMVGMLLWNPKGLVGLTLPEGLFAKLKGSFR